MVIARHRAGRGINYSTVYFRKVVEVVKFPLQFVNVGTKTSSGRGRVATSVVSYDESADTPHRTDGLGPGCRLGAGTAGIGGGPC